MRYSSNLNQMVVDIRVPAVCDTFDLQSCFECTQCHSHLGSRPVTAQCGRSFCRDCLLASGACPIDGCRSYSAGDCPHDVVLGDLLEEIHRIIAENDAKGVWRKRKRASPPDSNTGSHATSDVAAPFKPKSDSPDSHDSLQLRYKKIDNEPSPPNKLKNPTPELPSAANVDRGEVIERPTDLSQVDDALEKIKDEEKETEVKSITPTESTSSRKDSMSKEINPEPPASNKLLERQVKRDKETKDNDLWKVIRRNVAESFFSCSVCSNCFLEPMTLRCGHTFCRECFHHSIDQSSFNLDKGFCQPTCPSCRSMTGILLPNGEAPHHENTWNWTTNLSMSKLISTCWIPELEDSKLMFKNATKVVPTGMQYPLFVCTTALPTQPTDLRVFESRYRTMLRRVLRTEDRTFAMSLGTSDPGRPFQSIGVLLQIQSVVYQEMDVSYPVVEPPLRDMETYVFSKGIKRIHIEEFREHDGYLTVRTTPVADNDETMEAELERDQVSYLRSVDPELSAVNFDAANLTLDWLARALPSYPGLITRLKTTEILQLLREFVDYERGRIGPVAWNRIILDNRGNVPSDTQPADFSWWLTGVFFSTQSDRQQLLEMRSSRQRLIYLLERVGQAWTRLRR